jgi:hypothetical protein
MTHLAYNLATGEVLTTNRANRLKRWVKRHTANDREWAKANEIELPRHCWVFAHGSSYTDCIAKLTARATWGQP